MTDSPNIERTRYEELDGNPFRLGRHFEKDPRSLRYAISPLTIIRPAEHLSPIPYLNQGQLGSCVGNAATRHLAALLGAGGIAAVVLAGKTLSGTDADQDEQFAVETYHQASVADGFPGEYPPDDTGSSGLAACQVYQTAKLITNYLWATSLQAWASLMQANGCIIGVPWYQAWFEPSSADGFVDAGNWQASGVAGGHEIYVAALEAWDDNDPSKVIFRCDNSWGTSWGDHGSFRLRGSTYQTLMQDIDVKQFVR